MKRLIIAAMALFIGSVMLSGCTCCHMKKTDATKVTLGAHEAVTPVSRPDEWWGKRHQAILDQVKQGNVDMIFVGDSITQGWGDAGKDVWQQYYAKRNAINMGFSGDKTQHVLWRLQNGEIGGISPKLAVLMIGTNNSDGDQYTAQQIGEGIIAICQVLRKDLPNTKILVLAIFPRGERPSPQRQKNADASKLALTIADNKWIYYMDIGNRFLGKDGTLPSDIMPDYLHLTLKGYQMEAEAIEPTVVKLMGEKK
jgi:lysophospholipase L1-like esterase